MRLKESTHFSGSARRRGRGADHLETSIRHDGFIIRNALLSVRWRRRAPGRLRRDVRGRHAWNRRSEADLRDAIRWFQRSIDADPTYAPAYAGMADAYAQVGYGSYVAPEESFARARAAAVRALELDATLPEAHAALGFTLMYYDWDFADAEVEYR
jgi:hypothetical protein